MARGDAGRHQESAKTGDGYRLAEWLNTHIDTLTTFTNEQLSDALGYARPNIISMWRTGRTRVPLEKLEKVCELLKVDMITLLPLWLEQYMEPGAGSYGKIMQAAARMVTEDESELIAHLRNVTKGHRFKVNKGAENHLKMAITIR